MNSLRQILLLLLTALFLSGNCHSTSISVYLNNAPIPAVARVLSEISSCNIVVDGQLSELKVNLSGENNSLETLLNEIAKQHRLNLVTLDNTTLITTKKTIPQNLITSNKRVSLDLYNAKLDSVFKVLYHIAGEQSVRPSSDARISISLTDVPVADAIRIVDAAYQYLQ